jgi:hypothetical protein
MLVETAAASIPYDSAKATTRVDVALLVSTLFLQRFTIPLPFGKSLVSLDFVSVVFICLHQYLSGKMLIRYDRLLWFLATGLTATCSLLLNFKSTMLSSYSQFLVMYSLVTLSRPSTPDRYKSTLQAFQILVMVLSFLAVVQFVAQFVVDGRKLLVFYGLVPDFLLANLQNGWNTIHPIEGSSLVKSNGIFLAEPSILSQITALGILIEVLEFCRPRWLFVMVLGLLTAYSGTGLVTLLLFLPLAGLLHGRASLSALLVVMFMLGLFATGIIDLSVFLGRVGEFEHTGTSGYGRFVTPFLVAAEFFDTASLQALVVGSGPGTATALGDTWIPEVAGWLKLPYEYGIIGSFIFVCFSVSCLKRSRCPRPVLAALIFTLIFHVGYLTFMLFIIVVLCTVHGPEPAGGRIDDASRCGPSLVARSAAV